MESITLYCSKYSDSTTNPVRREGGKCEERKRKKRKRKRKKERKRKRKTKTKKKKKGKRKEKERTREGKINTSLQMKVRPGR